MEGILPVEQTLPPSLMNAFVAGCIALLVLVAGFFGSQWFKGLKASVDTLSTTIGKLNETFSSIKEKQAVHEERIDQHREELDELWKHTCQNPDCPYRGDRRSHP